MNFADFGQALGTQTRHDSVVEGMVRLAKELGVNFHLGETVEEILVENKQAIGIRSNGKSTKPIL